MSYPSCRHIMTNGDQCQSPRLREQDFCYFHHRTRSRHQALLNARPDSPLYNTEGEVIGWGQPVGFEDRRLPNLGPLEDRASVQMAIAAVVNGLLTGRIPRSKAATLLYGLQLASSNFPRTENDFRNPPSDPVAEVETSQDGTLLAPSGRIPATVRKEQEEPVAQQEQDETEEVELSLPVPALRDCLDIAAEEDSPAPVGITAPGIHLSESRKRYTQVAMSTLDRRRFLSLAAAAGTVPFVPQSLLAAAPSQEFSFLFLTDTHIQPELHAAQGCSMAFKRALSLHTDFAIQGGDHIFDGLAVPLAKSTDLFHLYDETAQQLSLKTYHTVGNHDVLGIYKASGMNPGDTGYGKAYFEQHIGPRYQSFDHKGVHFIILDSIGITPERGYYGLIEAEQMDWLKADLAKLAPQTPIIITSHIPLVTAYAQYAPPYKGNGYSTLSVSNTYAILPLLEGHNVLGVLQGHTHINERVEFNGIQYLTGGAVCGNWWEGVHRGTPEGFTVCTVRDGKLTTRYETYGFKADLQGPQK